MKSAMIDILEGVIWIAIVLLVVIGGAFGFIYGIGGIGNGTLHGVLAGVLGAIAGLCIAAVLCGPMLVLLQMRDALQAMRKVS